MTYRPQAARLHPAVPLERMGGWRAAGARPGLQPLPPGRNLIGVISRTPTASSELMATRWCAGAWEASWSTATGSPLSKCARWQRASRLAAFAGSGEHDEPPLRSPNFRLLLAPPPPCVSEKKTYGGVGGGRGLVASLVRRFGVYLLKSTSSGQTKPPNRPNLWETYTCVCTHAGGRARTCSALFLAVWWFGRTRNK